MTIRKIMVGLTFGRLLVIAESAKSRPSKRYLVCRCECGTESVVGYQNLTDGMTKSCGCLRVETARQAMTKHGATLHGKKSRTWFAWIGMRARCADANPKGVNYRIYFARGIMVCDRWQNSFENFLADMGDCPNGLTLERKDNYRGYEPGNCVWATRAEQRRNRRPYSEWNERPPTGCKVPGCTGEHDGRGYCRSHYKRFMRHGDPLIVKRQRKNNVHHIPPGRT